MRCIALSAFPGHAAEPRGTPPEKTLCSRFYRDAAEAQLVKEHCIPALGTLGLIRFSGQVNERQ
jgi:hypothetical protein